ncbi:hypothetical protein ACYOEI_21215, partial [Singulisphaera rosea]
MTENSVTRNSPSSGPAGALGFAIATAAKSLMRGNTSLRETTTASRTTTGTRAGSRVVTEDGAGNRRDPFHLVAVELS